MSGLGGEGVRGLGCGKRESVERVSVFGLRSCMWGVGRGLGPGSGEVGCCNVCVRCESGFSL